MVLHDLTAQMAIQAKLKKILQDKTINIAPASQNFRNCIAGVRACCNPLQNNYEKKKRKEELRTVKRLLETLDKKTFSNFACLN